MTFSQRLRRVACFVTLAGYTSLAPLTAQFVFNPVYTGGTPDQQAVTTSALNSLATYFIDNITLKVEITIEDLGDAVTLGSSSVSDWSQVGGSGYFYPAPLYNALTGTDLAGATTSITFNMNNNDGITWDYDTGEPGADVYSWQSVVMHEVLHSLGFFDGIADDSGSLANPGYTIFDSFTTRGTGNVSFTSYTTDAERADAITSDDLFWTGTFGQSANGDNPVKLYAPTTFEEGSTYSHIDPSETDAGGLLFPSLLDDTYFAGPTAVELGILQDMGWSTVAVPESSAFPWVFAGLSVTFVVWRRGRRLGSRG